MHKPQTAPKTAADRAGADGAFLGALGERVRALRARRGLTRSTLARDSGVSLRFLAQLEAGRANISVVRLRRIAAAMDASLAELAGDVAAPAPDAARADRIAIVGLRGAGKSTIGAAAAARLGVPFIELDREIEREAGASLGEIFDLHGQVAYRRFERRCLEKLIERHQRAVIATGGSIVTEKSTYQRLLESCFTVWLRTSPDEHMNRVIAQGDFRPMAGHAAAMDDLRRILASRGPLYGRADTELDTSGRTVEASVDAFLALVRAGPR